MNFKFALLFWLSLALCVSAYSETDYFHLLTNPITINGISTNKIMDIYSSTNSTSTISQSVPVGANLSYANFTLNPPYATERNLTSLSSTAWFACSGLGCNYAYFWARFRVIDLNGNTVSTTETPYTLIGSTLGAYITVSNSTYEVFVNQGYTLQVEIIVFNNGLNPQTVDFSYDSALRNSRIDQTYNLCGFTGSAFTDWSISDKNVTCNNQTITMGSDKNITITSSGASNVWLRLVNTTVTMSPTANGSARIYACPTCSFYVLDIDSQANTASDASKINSTDASKRYYIEANGSAGINNSFLSDYGYDTSVKDNPACGLMMRANSSYIINSTLSNCAVCAFLTSDTSGNPTYNILIANNNISRMSIGVLGNYSIHANISYNNITDFYYHGFLSTGAAVLSQNGGEWSVLGNTFNNSLMNRSTAFFSRNEGTNLLFRGNTLGDECGLVVYNNNSIIDNNTFTGSYIGSYRVMFGSITDNTLIILNATFSNNSLSYGSIDCSKAHVGFVYVRGFNITIQGNNWTNVQLAIISETADAPVLPLDTGAFFRILDNRFINVTETLWYDYLSDNFTWLNFERNYVYQQDSSCADNGSVIIVFPPNVMVPFLKMIDNNITNTVSNSGTQLTVLNNSNVYALNTSINKSKIEVNTGSILNFSWYLGVRIVDYAGNPIQNANVSIYDNGVMGSPTLLYNALTNSTGYITTQNVTEFLNSSGTVTNFTPHNVTVFKATNGLTEYNSTLVTLDSNQFIVMQLDTSGCGTLTSNLTLTGNVASNGTCFTIGANNVTLDCAGYSIVGDITNVSANGVYSEYNYSVIENCVIKDFGEAGIKLGEFTLPIRSYYNNVSYNNLSYNYIGLFALSYYDTVSFNDLSYNNYSGATEMGSYYSNISYNNASYNNVTGIEAGKHSNVSFNTLLVNRDNCIYIDDNNTVSYNDMSCLDAICTCVDVNDGDNQIYSNNITSHIPLVGKRGIASILNGRNIIYSNNISNFLVGIYSFENDDNFSYNTIYGNQVGFGFYNNNSIFHDNTLNQSGDVMVGDDSLPLSFTGNLFYNNTFINGSDFYINVSSYSYDNWFNTSVGGVAQGNYYATLPENVFDNNGDGWADAIPNILYGIPLNSTNFPTKWSGAGEDWGPAKIGGTPAGFSQLLVNSTILNFGTLKNGENTGSNCIALNFTSNGTSTVALETQSNASYWYNGIVNDQSVNNTLWKTSSFAYPTGNQYNSTYSSVATMLPKTDQIIYFGHGLQTNLTGTNYYITLNWRVV